MQLREKNINSNDNIMLLSNTLSYQSGLKSSNQDFENKCDESSKMLFFLRVVADMNPSRAILPQKIIWDDGREFKIQKITDIRRGFVKEIGELCMKYYCLIDGNFRILCLNDDMQWFALK